MRFGLVVDTPWRAPDSSWLTWIAVYLFVGFVGGFQGFQNYITNAYMWILFGMLFALPSTHGASSLGHRAPVVR